MPFKKILLIGSSFLLLMGAGSASVSASAVHSHKPARSGQHLNNVKKFTHERAVHNRNVHRINRIKRHLLNHQKNLIKVSRRINRLKRHRHNASLIKQLNADKASLINAIQHNERGMLRLAKAVANEEHQINLVRHPKASNEPIVTNVQLPSVNNDPDVSSVERSVTTVINEVNGKLTKYVAKDSTAKRHNRQASFHQISDVNGHYSATPNQITSDEINQLNQQIQDQIQNSNQWFNSMNQEINQIF